MVYCYKLRSDGTNCLDVGVAAPTLSISAFTAEDNIIAMALKKFKINISLKHEVLTYDNAPWKKALHWENGISVEQCSYNDSDFLDEQKLIDTYKELIATVNDIEPNLSHVVATTRGPLLIVQTGNASLGFDNTIYGLVDGKVETIFSDHVSTYSLFFFNQYLLTTYVPNSQEYYTGIKEATITLLEFKDGKYNAIDSAKVPLTLSMNTNSDAEDNSPSFNSGSVENQLAIKNCKDTMLQKYDFSDFWFASVYDLEHKYCLENPPFGQTEYIHGCK